MDGQTVLDRGRYVLDSLWRARLLAIPNVSEGRDRAAIEAIGAAFDARLLDIHSDPDHHRSVFTLAGDPRELCGAVLARSGRGRPADRPAPHEGIHPRVGAIDVAPIVYLDPADRGAACAEALVLGDLLGEELDLPVFLYGELAQGRTQGGAAARRPRESRRAAIDPGRAATPTSGRAACTRPPAPCWSRRARRCRLQRRAGATGDGRRRPGHRRADPGRRPRRTGDASARSGCGSTPAGWPRCRPTWRTTDDCRWPESSTAIARHATPSRAELVGLAPRAAFEGFPTSCRWPTGARSRMRWPTNAERSTVATRPAPPTKLQSTMAQTKRKRRTKHRGNAAGTIETPRSHRPPARDRGAQEADRGQRPASAG